MAWREIAAIYRAYKKKKDINWFTEWCCRPCAAAVVFTLKNVPITPNQLSFLSFLVACLAGAMFVFCLSHLWLTVAAVIYHVSFIFDCSDGMLARYRKATSVLGHLLDFLMDQVKAMMIFACVTVRLYRVEEDATFLMAGIVGLFALATGLTLTSFMRRPEYSGQLPTEDGQPAVIPERRGLLGRLITLFEHTARSVVHYPQYLWICAFANRLDIYFWAYGAVNVLYVGRAGLTIAWKLGRSASHPATKSPPIDG